LEDTASPPLVPPGNEAEKKLVEIWSTMLEIKKENISIDTDFFRLGGHSLKATALVSRIRKEFNVVVPLIEVFKNSTIQLLAEYIKRRSIKNLTPQDDGLILLKPGKNSEKHFFFIHDGTGKVDGYIEFCRGLPRSFNYWGIPAHELENPGPRVCTLEELAGTYIEKIKTLQPQGPYLIAGWSLGGTIAFEMALQLENRGESISFLGLIDAPGPRGEHSLHQNAFPLESEKNWINQYLSDNEIKERIEKVTDIDELWSIFVNHLAGNDFNLERIRQLIPLEMAQTIPHFHQLGIRELAAHLNTYRTLKHAGTYYLPSGKILTPVHYFRASQTPLISREKWNAYCTGPMKFHTIPGDHFSILKKPGVEKTAKIFTESIMKLL
jgi:thioesterase domain-containing protein/acyl carrier protein